MNIIAICGSPRRGNTEFVLKRILTKAEKFGASSELVLLREKRIEFCDGCLNCEDGSKCGIRDDMQIIYPKLEEADLIIFGSPVYFDCVTGLMKNFLDRLNPMVSKNSLDSKKFAFIVIGQAGVGSLNKTIKYIENFVDIAKMSMVGDFGLIAQKSQDIENNSDKIKKIDEFTENLIG